MKKWLWLMVFALVGLAIFMWLNSEAGNEPKERNVRTLIVQNNPLLIQKNFKGNVRSFKRREVKFQVSGQLLSGEKTLKMGSMFSQDQVLYRIDNRSLFFELKGQKEEFKKKLAEAIWNYPSNLLSEREKWLQFAENVSPVKILPEFPTISSVEENLYFEEIASSYQAILNVESKMENYFYFAPFSGRVEKVYTDINSSVKRYEAIATIISTPKYWLDLIVSNEESGRFEKGKSYHFSNGNLSIVGKCQREKSNSSEDSIALVFEMFPSKDIVLDADMYWICSFSDTLFSQCALIPSNAIKNDQVVVFLDEKYAYKKVEVQRKEEDSIWVSGLSNGDIISIEYFVSDSSIIYNPIK